MIESALAGIKRIEPKLDRISLSGAYSYPDIKERLGRMMKSGPDSYQLQNYKNKWYCQLPEGKVGIFSHPKPQYIPKCRISANSPSPALLSKLNQTMPGLTVSSVEYCIDFMCGDSQAVMDLFAVFAMTLYVPYSKRVAIRGGGYKGYRQPRDENSVLMIMKSAKSYRTNYFKEYEKGPGHKKILLKSGKKGWSTKDIDRVRVETTLFSKGCKLQLNGRAISLSNFLSGFNSHRVWFPENRYDEFTFSQFVNSKILPVEGFEYPCTPQSGIAECFMWQYLYWKTQVSTISRNRSRNPYFDELTRLIKAELQVFDTRWTTAISKSRNEWL